MLDNRDRKAPAAFNEHEWIEVTRRIERDEGSTYRVNGREVRARDVQLLFADASTGARSPALVRQGQIGEIIAAKPQARRLILEEAAGISGLHSRRHEAELRLKGAEDNLLRVEDVLKQIDVQVESLKRQARQSTRYRSLAADIRRHDALAHLIAWREQETAFADAAKKLELGPARCRRAHPRPGRGRAAAGAGRSRPALPARGGGAPRGGAASHHAGARRARSRGEAGAGARGRTRTPRRPVRPRPRARAGADRRRRLGRRAAGGRGPVPRRGPRQRRLDCGGSARTRGRSPAAPHLRRGRSQRGAGRIVRSQRPPARARGRSGRGRPPARPTRSGLCGNRARARFAPRFLSG